jgi:GT2 family glycosyltransferase
MNNHPKIGVVTVTYNSEPVICEFMDSLMKQTESEFVVYVIDNASSDKTLERLFEYRAPNVFVIRSPTNIGVAAGNNLGILAALKDGCAAVLLINNDTVFDCDLLSTLWIGLQQYKCDMIVPKILYFDDPQKIWCAGGYFSRIRGSARHFGNGLKDNGDFNQQRVVSYSPTCCMLIRKEVFERIGLMDSNYFVYFDDTDFCLRAHRAELKLFYLPAGRLLHKVGSLTGGNSDFYYRYTIRNHTYYLLKHFPGWQVIFYFLAYQIHLFVKFILLLRRPKTFLLAERAFWAGISLFYSRKEVAGF